MGELATIINSILTFTIISIFVVLFMIFVAPPILTRLNVSLRARRDYRLARGTKHKKQLQKSLKILDQKLKNLEKERQILENRLNALTQEQSDELLKALSRHIVETRLTEIEGIGQVLKDRLINQCFNGTLSSLTSAYFFVQGIGWEKQNAISKWVNKMERELPILLKKDFPNKQEIIEEYKRKKIQLKKS